MFYLVKSYSLFFSQLLVMFTRYTVLMQIERKKGTYQLPPTGSSATSALLHEEMHQGSLKPEASLPF